MKLQSSLLLLGLLSTTASAQVGTWSPTSPTANGRPCEGAVVLSSTGEVMDVSEDRVQRYNPYSNTWRTTNPKCTPSTCHTHSLTELPSGQILAQDLDAGGTRGGYPGLRLYDPAADSWSLISGVSALRDQTLTVLASGKVLLVGGQYPYSATGTTGFTAEYDPAAGTSTASGNLLSPRLGHTATLLYSGQVLVTGGIGDQSNGMALATAELYEPSTRTWTAAGTMSRPRASHRAVRLYSGSVLVLSDISNASDTSVDLYDPYNRRWSAGPALPFSQPTSATLLYSGEALVTNDAGQAAVYSPSQNAWLPAASAHASFGTRPSVRLQTGEVMWLNGGSPAAERFSR